MDDIRLKISNVSKGNDESLKEINSRKTTEVVYSYSYSLSMWLPNKRDGGDAFGFSVEPKMTTVKNRLEAWRYSSEDLLEIPDDIFDDRLDYRIVNFDDVVRLNKQLFMVANKILDSEQKSETNLSNLLIFLKNFERLRLIIVNLRDLTLDVRDNLTCNESGLHYGLREISRGFTKVFRSFPNATLLLTANHETCSSNQVALKPITMSAEKLRSNDKQQRKDLNMDCPNQISPSTTNSAQNKSPASEKNQPTDSSSTPPVQDREPPEGSSRRCSVDRAQTVNTTPSGTPVRKELNMDCRNEISTPGLNITQIKSTEPEKNPPKDFSSTPVQDKAPRKDSSQGIDQRSRSLSKEARCVRIVEGKAMLWTVEKILDRKETMNGEEFLVKLEGGEECWETKDKLSVAALKMAKENLYIKLKTEKTPTKKRSKNTTPNSNSKRRKSTPKSPSRSAPKSTSKSANKSASKNAAKSASKKASKSASKKPPIVVCNDDSEKEIYWEVDTVLNYRLVKKNTEFLIKWKGGEESWEPEGNLCDSAIESAKRMLFSAPQTQTHDV